MAAADELKARGDALYREGRFAAAAAAYGDALAAAEAARDPAPLAVLYSNRAAARVALREWQGALADALQAAAVDGT
jgi:tetratricopeptide (TPR) repeat protein